MVHCGHASSTIVRDYQNSLKGTVINQWYIDGDQTKIVLSVRDLVDLHKYHQIALSKGICAVFVADKGYYEVPEGEILMCGILCSDEQAEEIGLKKLKLYKGENVLSIVKNKK